MWTELASNVSSLMTKAKVQGMTVLGCINCAAKCCWPAVVTPIPHLKCGSVCPPSPALGRGKMQGITHHLSPQGAGHLAGHFWCWTALPVEVSFVLTLPLQETEESKLLPQARCDCPACQEKILHVKKRSHPQYQQILLLALKVHLGAL